MSRRIGRSTGASGREEERKVGRVEERKRENGSGKVEVLKRGREGKVRRVGERRREKGRKSWGEEEGER